MDKMHFSRQLIEIFLAKFHVLGMSFQQFLKVSPKYFALLQELQLLQNSNFTITQCQNESY